MSAYVVGLTGGIGSGKTTVANRLLELGAALVDTDAIAHDLTRREGAAMPEIIAAFGWGVVDANGALDRAAMRQLVFADPVARQGLEAILHPRIRQLSVERCLAATAPYVVLAVPLLVEAGDYRQRCDRIAVVDCADEAQIERVMARSKLDRSEVRRIMSTQASREVRRAAADDIIDNDGDLAALIGQVDALHQRYLLLSAEKLKANC